MMFRLSSLGLLMIGGTVACALRAQPIRTNSMNMDSLKCALDTVSQDKERVNTLLRLCVASMAQSPKEVIGFAQEAHELAKKCGMIPAQVSASAYWSVGEMSKGNYANAMDIAVQGFLLGQKHISQCEPEMAFISGAMGNIYYTLDEPDSTLKYNRIAYALHKKGGRRDNMIRSMNNIGLAFFQKKLLDSALSYYESALKMRTNVPPARNAFFYQNIGDVYLQKGNSKKALEYFSLSLAGKKATGNTANMPQTYMGISMAYKALQQKDSALYYATLANELSHKIGTKHLIGEAHKVLAQVHNARGEYQQGYDYLMRYIEAEDSTRSDDQLRAVALSEIRVRWAQKEHQNAKLSADLANSSARLEYQKTLLWATILIVLLIAVVVAMSFQLYRSRQQALLDAQNRKLLAYLHANSHDLRAPLARILGLLSIFPQETLSSDNQKLIQAMQTSATELDSVVHAINQQLIEDKQHTDEQDAASA